jgi:cytochrome c peroxidase
MDIEKDMSMPRTPDLRLALSCLLLAPLLACGDSDSDSSNQAEMRGRANALFSPLVTPEPPKSALAQARIDLGRRLFFESRISSDGDVSCGTCHLPERRGADGLSLSIGVDGEKTPRNSPTVFNSADQVAQHWRGDRTSLEDQAEQALEGAFGNDSADESLDRLEEAGYEPDFQEAFPESPTAISPQNYAAAIAAYERTLVTPSRFDSFLDDEDATLESQELDGLADFIDLGCSDCHNGPLLGGGAFKTFGVARDYWDLTGSSERDEGLSDVTDTNADRYVFKVPNLRNVEYTGPYFHDGSVVQIDEAVRVMAEAQLGHRMTDDEVTHIVAFLRTLSAPVPDDFAPLAETFDER